jgi:hypothetical protein
MRTIGNKPNYMLKNVIGNKRNKTIKTIGNKILPDPIYNKNEFTQPGVEIFAANPNMKNVIHMITGLKKLHIATKKNIYEKRKK